MGGMISAPDRDPFALMMQSEIIALQQSDFAPVRKKTQQCNNPRRSRPSWCAALASTPLTPLGHRTRTVRFPQKR